MHSTSSRFLSCLWRQTTTQHLTSCHRQLQKVATRQLASKGGSWRGSKDADRNRQSPPVMPQRPIMRETNMWKDPQRLDTKWLRARDPRSYKPDFGQTEPHSLRKQFMRSPDERTRDAMSRDWEAAIQLNEMSRRQALLVTQQRNHDKQRSGSDPDRRNQRSRRSTKTKNRDQEED